MKKHDLIKLAQSAREKAYAPYSEFKVGAALLTSNGKVFTGTNVENASYGLTICAERVAVCKAVSEGEKDFKTIAVVGSSEGLVFPCGACLQVLAEFSDRLNVLVTDKDNNIEEYNIKELLPKCFSVENRR
ncbi:MAG: cytidine deaminase [Syntrophomonadaceae bacterium]|jgi:cytidine deaminase